METFGALIAFVIAVMLVLFQMSVIYPLPLSDLGAVRYRTQPTMTWLLILANGILFIVWQAPDYYRAETVDQLQPYLNKIWTYGYREVFMTQGLSIGAFTTFTSMFMHADIWHLFGNMIFLWTFGRRLEDACGPWRFLLFYLIAGMVANIGSVVLNPTVDQLPSVGASGAIAGVMGAFLVLFPRAQIQCLWFLGMILWLPYRLIRGHEQPLSRFVVLPAFLILVYFAVRELLPSLQTIAEGSNVGGVNNLAHLLGFAAGPLVLLFVRKDMLARLVARRAA
jgi:membrane associated rhomboid family serine protease